MIRPHPGCPDCPDVHRRDGVITVRCDRHDTEWWEE